MRIRNADNGRPKARFSGRLSAAVDWVLRRNRPDMIGDLTETNRPDQTYQLFWPALATGKGKVRRSFCPPLAILYGSPNRETKKRRIRKTFPGLDRAAKSFVVAYAMLAGVNVTLLPEGRFLNVLFVFGPTVMMASAIRLHWKSWGGTGLEDSVCKDDDERFVEQLKRWIDVLLDGTFSPSEAMVRSAIEALSIMLMYLIPLYGTLQFSVARNYSDDVTWSGILWRYVFAILLTFLYVHLRKTNRFAGRIFQQELNALRPLVEVDPKNWTRT